MQTLNEFLGQYYELFANLESNKSQLSEEFYYSARKLLMNRFNEAVLTFLDEQELLLAEYRFELKFKVANYTPRRHFLFWWNRKAKVLLKQYRAELERYLSELSKDTNDAQAKEIPDNLPVLKEAGDLPYPRG